MVHIRERVVRSLKIRLTGVYFLGEKMKITNPFKGMTAFEIVLFTASLVAVVVSFIFSPSKNYLNLAASVIGVIAIMFVAKGHVFGQILTVVFSVCYGIISYFFRYYGEMITYLALSAPMAVGAIIVWIKNPYKQTSEVKIRKLTKLNVILTFVISIAVTVAFYFILKALNTNNLIFGTISVFTSCIAATLVILRSPYYGLGYAINDLVLIVLWALATTEDLSYIPMICCFAMFFIDDIYGFVNWRKMLRRQEKDS